MWCAASPRHLQAVVVGGMKAAALLSIGIPAVALAEPLHRADGAAGGSGCRVPGGRPPTGWVGCWPRQAPWCWWGPGMISGYSS